MSTARVLPPETGHQDPEAQFRLYPLAKGKRTHGDSIEELTGLSRDTLEAEIRAGRLKPTRVRGRVMVRAENLQAWLESCEKEPVVIRGRRHRADRALERASSLEELERAASLEEFRQVRDRVLAKVGRGAL
jgi:excisionase family DNA binding protein